MTCPFPAYINYHNLFLKPHVNEIVTWAIGYEFLSSCQLIFLVIPLSVMLMRRRLFRARERKLKEMHSLRCLGTGLLQSLTSSRVPLA